MRDASQLRLQLAAHGLPPTSACFACFAPHVLWSVQETRPRFWVLFPPREFPDRPQKPRRTSETRALPHSHTSVESNRTRQQRGDRRLLSHEERRGEWKLRSSREGNERNGREFGSLPSRNGGGTERCREGREGMGGDVDGGESTSFGLQLRTSRTLRASMLPERHRTRRSGSTSPIPGEKRGVFFPRTNPDRRRVSSSEDLPFVRPITSHFRRSVSPRDGDRSTVHGFVPFNA